MKLLLTIFLAGVFFCASGQGEQNFETPSSPAFTILDFEPSSVLRPTTPSELKSNIASAFDENGKLRPNIGLEVAPYWLSSHPNLTPTQYRNPDLRQTIFQTLSFSAATKYDSVLKKTIIGTGIKFQLLQGDLHENSDSVKARSGYLQIMADVTSVSLQVDQGFVKTRADAIKLIVGLVKAKYGATEAKALEKELNELKLAYTDSNDSIKNMISKILADYGKKAATVIVKRKRIGWIVEVAGATRFVPVNTESGVAVKKAGGWVTIAKRNEKDQDFLLTIRMLGSYTDTTRRAIDAGLAYVKDVDNFNISVEGVFRGNTIEYDDINSKGEATRTVKRSTTYRIAATVQYAINEYVKLNFSLGKNYKDPLQLSGTFFATAGLGFNLFRKEVR